MGGAVTVTTTSTRAPTGRSGTGTSMRRSGGTVVVMRTVVNIAHLLDWGAMRHRHCTSAARSHPCPLQPVAAKRGVEGGVEHALAAVDTGDQLAGVVHELH